MLGKVAMTNAHIKFWYAQMSQKKLGITQTWGCDLS
jgi:hypothetical protein